MIDEDVLNKKLGVALAGVLRERQVLLTEAWEDLALEQAILIGLLSPAVTRDEVFKQCEPS
jgi:hypothetical protein